MAKSSIHKRKTVFHRVMILIHYAHLKDLTGMSNHILVINALMHNHFTIRQKNYAESALTNNYSILLQSNVLRKLLLLCVCQIKSLILKPISVKQKERLLCVLLQLLTGMLLTLDVCNALPKSLISIKIIFNVNPVLKIMSGL